MNTNISVAEAIKQFYTNNRINPESYVSDNNMARTHRLDIDKFIGKDIFEPNFMNWINSFDTNHRVFFLNLISKYTYVNNREYIYLLNELVDEVIKEISIKGYDISQVLFITVESKVKSGGDNIRASLQIGHMNDITKDQIIAAVSKVENEKIENAKVIVFLDDIIGTGFTTFTNIKNVCERFANVKIADKELMIACLYARNKAIKDVVKWCRKQNILIKPVYYNELKSCFDNDYIFSQKELEDAKKIISNYEKEIDENPKIENKDYFLGFRQSKLLISFSYDTPNNTLCNFWKYSDKSSPLFPRQTQRRPSVSELRQKKDANFNNAYKAGRVKNDASN